MKSTANKKAPRTRKHRKQESTKDKKATPTRGKARSPASKPVVLSAEARNPNLFSSHLI
ncbi:hypothetical protein K491DRAFT_228983 [Lophiostoma macrostomum CBS 122681]|uniref:Uncharacterized protein n=1 Tax=Lophiostoma macrostomum CBS 122681 TaxID=1314788 RepID=A0A6A6SLN9_9PLEO|nr:hypothetical protein K491DRAFT_228983 [Lophiostoma macrostomum CBS 122681]